MQPAKRVNIVSVKLVKESSMLYKQRRVRSPQDSYELFRDYLGEVDREHFVVMKTAILSSSASIICCHPHPSGDPTPSPEDIEVTQRLYECGRLLGIELLDHIIIGDNKYISLKEKGYF